MDEVRADEELRASIGDGADRVCVPDFLEEAFSHGVRCPPWLATGGKTAHADLECQSRMLIRLKETGTSAEFDDQAGDDSRQCEHADDDYDDFQPLPGTPDLGGRTLDPVIPSSPRLGLGTVVITHLPNELRMS